MTETMTITDKKRTLIFLNIVVTCIASTILSTALTTALPSIMADLQISAGTGQWLTSGYSLVMGITMPLTAFLITRFPTKRLYLCALLIFLVGLTLSAFSMTFPVMMFSRALQACGNGILSSMAQVILLTIYPVEKRGAVMGWYGLSVSAAPVIAPTLAGIIVDLAGWRAIFFISIGVVLIALVFTILFFENVLEVKKSRFDFASFVLSALAFTGITLGIGNMGSLPFFSIPVTGILAAGCVSCAVFTRRQFRLAEPFLDLRVLRNRNYTLSVIGSMLLYLVMMGSSVMMPLYVQSAMGYSATVSGLTVLPGSLAMAVVSPLAGKIYDRLGMKRLFIAGAAFMLVSNAGMYFITLQTPLWLAAVFNAVRCVSIGCLMMPLVTWGIGSVHSGLAAHGTALLTSLRTIAGAVGSAVFVGLSTAAASSFTGLAENAAFMKGLNVSFLAMAGVTLILLSVAVFAVKDAKKRG